MPTSITLMDTNESRRLQIQQGRLALPVEARIQFGCLSMLDLVTELDQKLSLGREARRLGFGEGIAMASTGLLSEGAGENLFLVFDGVLHTTPASASILTGITRDTLKTLAHEDGIEVVERDIPREYLYLCDELLMCGTAAEITPIRSVDGKQIGNGKAGRVTRRLQELFFGLFNGKTNDQWGWLEPL